ncbi:MAG: hypothetical protein ACK4PH_11490 [Aquincola tertiaricarbonis]
MPPESPPAVPSALPPIDARANSADTTDPAFVSWCTRMRIPATPQALEVWRAVAASPTPRQYGKIEL